jgi:hypothetical protein
LLCGALSSARRAHFRTRERASGGVHALAEPAAIVASAWTPPEALSRVRKWARRADESAPHNNVSLRLPQFRAPGGRSQNDL